MGATSTSGMTSTLWLCFGVFIALKFNILRNDYVCITSVDVGSMLDVDLVLLVAGPVFMVRCLAGVDVAGDVVGLKLHVVLW